MGAIFNVTFSVNHIPNTRAFPKKWQERDGILSSLRRRSMMVHRALNEMEGITCNKADGALYAFPRIRLSNKAVEAAAAKGIPTDEYYCLKVTGLVSTRELFRTVREVI